ncbi:MAG TPA: rRNA maturation RNase YbeY [Candidatus Cloacimonadota bacterium]|jgi:probable rRNA maturation factor|nr:rRNA maturation RNase YbeY [Candidatus Cloacimonadota bacterium]HOF59003.1 rRNA maturation RNase YbeY [Candidatus Cloacimonadota bacterium]HOR58197.1 rRNA maturation RNase YbeY [Candidatus Cloacimonadota bacterium]HPB08912.1 rRNA maturation RNase YbeY [Candidatus Cloacimonadota bacterium]HPL22744.1 rRNA maturation RNase YbeY [Candidatus Cloacimonadota bacterium]
MTDCQFNLINQSGCEIDEQLLERCFQLVCQGESPRQCFELNLVLCTDREMQKFNRIYRGSESVTDVLSFSSQGSQDPSLPPSVTPSHDIIIDTNQINRQKGKKSFEWELVKVFIHGLLHVLGYDHLRQNDRKEMQDKEFHYNKIIQGE